MNSLCACAAMVIRRSVQQPCYRLCMRVPPVVPAIFHGSCQGQDSKMAVTLPPNFPSQYMMVIGHAQLHTSAHMAMACGDSQMYTGCDEDRAFNVRHCQCSHTYHPMPDMPVLEAEVCLKEAEFENIVAQTLDSLAEYLENLPEIVSCSDDFDITLGDGVLTLSLGSSLGTYVINKQTPNKQIWLSSPVSGPKRYDYHKKRWVYSRDNSGLHSLLEKELSTAFHTSIDLSSCAFYS